jgi:hypothetical protein
MWLSMPNGREVRNEVVRRFPIRCGSTPATAPGGTLRQVWRNGRRSVATIPAKGADFDTRRHFFLEPASIIG